MVDGILIEIGYQLLPLVDREQEKNLLEQITMLRRKFDYKFAKVQIKDNLMLEANEFRICINGKENCLLPVDLRTSYEEQSAEIGKHLLSIILENQEELFQ